MMQSNNEQLYSLGTLFTAVLKKHKQNGRKYTLNQLSQQLAQQNLFVVSSNLSRWFNDKTTPEPQNIATVRALADILQFDTQEQITLNKFINKIAGSNKHIRGSASLPARYHFLHGTTFAFYGREQEQKKINRLLLARKSVFIYGLGGVGKTALARQIIQRYASSFIHGTEYIQLFPQQTEADILFQIGHIFGMNHLTVASVHASKELVLENLQLHTYGSDLLFLLDNVENKEQINNILTYLPHINWVVTSRRDLFLFQQENRIELSPPHENVATQMLFHYANKMESTDEKDTAVLIANRLGNLPVFIAIAGAMVKSNFVPNLAELYRWLDDTGLKTISAGSWDGQQFLDLLLNMIPDENAHQIFLLTALFSRPQINSSIFYAIIEKLNLSKKQSLNELFSLSLFKKSEDNLYLELHPLIHEYAQLRAPNHSNYKQQQHAFNRQLTEFTIANNRGFVAINKEIDNILSVVDSLYRNKDWENLHALWSPTSWFLWSTSNYQQYIDYDQKFLTGVQFSQTDPRELTATIKAEIGFAYMRLGQMKQAKTYFTECQKLYEQIFDPQGMIRATRYQAILAIESQNWADARILVHETVEMMEDYLTETKSTEKWIVITQAFISDLQATICTHQNQWDDAEKHARKAIYYCYRQENNRKDYLINFQLRLAKILLAKTDLTNPEAFNLLQDVIAHAHDDGGEQAPAAEAYIQLGHIYHQQQKINLAVEHLNQAAEIFRQSGQQQKYDELHRLIKFWQI